MENSLRINVCSPSFLCRDFDLAVRMVDFIPILQAKSYSMAIFKSTTACILPSALSVLQIFVPNNESLAAEI